ncbi:glutamate synthase subunit beta [Winogradskyella sp. PE311]|uniref:glutamate synthase subunit beta n=1 Tax=Winogradskyella sp. PE311 TaxID=3366943 RepID=UPI0039807872
MGKTTGFLEYKRQDESYIAPEKRIENYKEFTIPLKEEKLKDQGARCMDCGIPFCHSGCPLGNFIPDFNDKVYKGKWKEAAEILHKTNNFPEFTGRLCPAPCEEACVLGINEDPVTIENIEKNIVETAFNEGWIVANPPKVRTDKKVAVIGSGPAGLAAAQQLNHAGHTVTVFERDEKVGGLLRYGIPDFKMEKNVIDRRVKVLEEEGITFKTNAHVGKNIDAIQLKNDFDAIVLCGGATVRRSIPIPGSDLKGVTQAMDFLKLNNEYVDGIAEFKDIISATDKNVIVIGGGDTGSDCIGTSNRHGAKSVTNFEILSKPSEGRPAHQPWPYWPMKLKTTSSHKEGVERFFSISTKEFLGDENGKLKGLKTVEVEWIFKNGERPQLIEVPNTEKEWECELALLALGFTGAEMTLAEQFDLKMDFRTNIDASVKDYATNIPGIFAAGDMRRGQSLIVWAISEGRQAAHHVDTYLMGESNLPLKDDSDLPRV